MFIPEHCSWAANEAAHQLGIFFGGDPRWTCISHVKRCDRLASVLDREAETGEMSDEDRQFVSQAALFVSQALAIATDFDLVFDAMPKSDAQWCTNREGRPSYARVYIADATPAFHEHRELAAKFGRELRRDGRVEIVPVVTRPGFEHTSSDGYVTQHRPAESTRYAPLRDIS